MDESAILKEQQIAYKPKSIRTMKFLAVFFHRAGGLLASSHHGKIKQVIFICMLFIAQCIILMMKRIKAQNNSTFNMQSAPGRC